MPVYPGSPPTTHRLNNIIWIGIPIRRTWSFSRKYVYARTRARKIFDLFRNRYFVRIRVPEHDRYFPCEIGSPPSSVRFCRLSSILVSSYLVRVIFYARRRRRRFLKPKNYRKKKSSAKAKQQLLRQSNTAQRAGTRERILESGASYIRPSPQQHYNLPSNIIRDYVYYMYLKGNVFHNSARSTF